MTRHHPRGFVLQSMWITSERFASRDRAETAEDFRIRFSTNGIAP